MTAKDGAMFWHCRDWMTDSHVLSMTYEQRGVYHWLLCLGWLEGGIPADEGALANILGLSKTKFRAAWKPVRECWEEHPDDPTRLVNAQQEQDRELLQEKRELRGAKGIRFAILQRDKFTCQYCGRGAPDVELHVDHATPRVAGGTDKLSNLVTACADCNLGKAARPLHYKRGGA